MKHWKSWAAAAVMVGVLVGGGSIASADPLRSKNSQLLDVHCEILGDFTVVTFSNGKFTPGLIPGSTGLGIPYKVETSVLFTPNEGDPFVFSEAVEHPAPHNGRLDVCTFHISFTDENGHGEGDGTAWISYSPPKKK